MFDATYTPAFLLNSDCIIVVTGTVESPYYSNVEIVSKKREILVGFTGDRSDVLYYYVVCVCDA
jgi:hypothetical protein